MKISSFLIPDNPIALTVVYFLAVLFVLWVIALVILWFFLASRKRQVKRCADVGMLTEAIRHRLSLNMSDNTSASDLKEFQDQSKAAFSEFCKTKKLKTTSAIAKHLQAIFDAGVNESRLEISPLVKNTSSYLLRTSSLLRSLLALFIIIGLLGTLAGLASTLGQLSQISAEEQAASAPSSNQNTSQPTTSESLQERTAKKLTTLLQQLKSAFAPSFLGVLFTILGVLLFGLFQQFSHAPLKDSLERYTLVNWVPALIPTPSQSLLEKLQLSEKQIHASLQSAKDVEKIAASFQDESSDLRKSIRDAKETIPQLTSASIHLGDFSGKFVDAVNALTPFQKELQQLYEQLRDESQTFHDAVEQSIERDRLFQQDVKQQLVGQNLQIVALLKGFKAYEKAYLATREGIDKNLDQLLHDAQNAYQSLAERNKEVISTMVSSLREPLSQDLVDGLDKVENSLDVRLTALGKSLELLHNPLQRAAAGLEGTLENLNNRTETLLKEVQQEFFNRNRLQDRQVTEIIELTEKFSNLLGQLASNNKVLTEYEQVLGAKVNELAQHVGSLGGNINEWNQSFSAGEFSNLLGQLASNNKLLTEYEQVLGANVNELAEHVGGLGGNVNGLAQNIGGLDGNVNGLNQSLSSGKFPTLLEQLANNNKVLSEYEKVLGAKVNELAQNVGGLGGNINLLSQSISANGRVSDSGSKSESIAELKKIVASNERLVSQLQTLVETLKKQIRPTSAPSKPPVDFRPPVPRLAETPPPRPIDVQPPRPPVDVQPPRPPVDVQPPPSIDPQPPPPSPDDQQPPERQKESLLKRAGNRVLFWRH